MNNKIKKTISAILCSVLALSLTACSPAAGSSSTASTGTSSDPASKVMKVKVLEVGASPSPHAQILKSCEAALLEKGIKLEITEFTDYVIPNKAVQSGELDANFFQHEPYLVSFNEKNKTNLVSVGAVHFEPMGIYAGKSNDLKAIADGAKIGIPNDTTNEARALQLLAAQGLIKLKDGIGLEATPKDIIENTKKLQFTEIEAAQLPRILGDVDFAVINGNYAIDAKITDKVIITEAADSEGAKTFANILAVKSGNENSEEVKALYEALTSEATKKFIADTFGKNVIPAV